MRAMGLDPPDNEKRLTLCILMGGGGPMPTQFNASLTEIFVTNCCNTTFLDTSKYDLFKKLMQHIRSKHPDVLATLDKYGRELARSQNGCGYYDGSDKDTGWPNAQESFKEAYREQALERILKGDKKL
jgi:hypothetical protein